MRSRPAATAAIILATTLLTAHHATARGPRPRPTNTDLVDLVDVGRALPTGARITFELRYATTNNFTHRAVYPVARCLLRRPVAERLFAVEQRLRARGLGLKLFDCYRPLSVQRVLWSIVPDERYVADPAKGSRHNRGAALDLTLIDAAGRELPMGTPFDDFTPRAHRDARDFGADTATVLANRSTLDTAMRAEGFTGLPTEWWHFDGAGWDRFGLLDVGLEAGLNEGTVAGKSAAKGVQPNAAPKATSKAR